MTDRTPHRGARAEPSQPAFPGASGAALAIAGAAPLAAYVATLHRGLPAGDSGELIAVAATAGVAHPPGYPLWVMLANAWLHVFPVGYAALRLNAFSALAMAAAAAVLAAAVTRASGSRLAGVFAAWAFAFALPVWKLALVAEVFALNAVLAALVLLALAPPMVAPPAARGAERVRLLALTFLAVLALSHHHTLLLLALPAALVALPPAWRAAAGRRAALVRDGALVKLLALAPLAWLPIAAHRVSAVRWGDAGTWRGFASLLLRSEYGTLRLDPAQAGLHADRSHGWIFLQALPASIGWLPLALAIPGAVWAWRRARPVAVTLLAYALLQALFFTRVGFPSGVPWLRGVIERFYVLPVLTIAFLAGLGAAALLARARGGARVALAGALALSLALPAGSRAPHVDQHGNRFTATLGRAILASLPPRAVVFVQGDLLHNALVELTRAGHERPDVTVVDQELLTYGWYVRQLRASDPALLPPLGRAQRIVLVDGLRMEGFAIRRPDGSVDVLTEQGQATLAAAQVLRVREAPAESLFRATRAGFRTAWPLEVTEDRYSGLPGTRNLLWFDHLAGRRPVATIGVRDASWSLRHALTPVGLAAWVSPRGSEPPATQQLAATLAVLDVAPLEPYFTAYDSTSFEAAERWRFAALAARAALLASQPGADSLVREHPVGHARLLAFARRFEALAPCPDAPCLRAIAYLRLFDPAFRDLSAAREDLRRYLASGDPAAARDDEARATLRQLFALDVRRPASSGGPAALD